jgi:hypothetical protein
MGAIAAAALLALGGFAQAPPEPPPSRSGIVLFRMPAGWQRQELSDFTALNPLDPAARKYAIEIRPAQEAQETAEASLAAHAELLAKTWKVQPLDAAVAQKHPAGYQAVRRPYALLGDNGLLLLAQVYLLQSGKKCVVIAFLANKPENFDPKAISGFVGACRLAHAEVEVPGDPALTLYDLEETIDCVQWLLDAPFTADQRRIFREEIVDGWKKKDAETFQSVATVMQLQGSLAKMTEEQRDVVRKQAEKELIAAMRKETDRCSKLAVEIYDAAHQPIAAGDPPLTRQQADSALELFYFMAGQLEGVQAAPSAAQKEAWAKNLVEGWPTMDVKARKTFEILPLTWSATRAGWREMSEAERGDILKGFAQYDVVKEMRASFAKTKSEAGPSSDTAAAAAALQAKLSSNFNLTSSMLRMNYNSTMSSMASFRNMTDSTYRWSYKPR